MKSVEKQKIFTYLSFQPLVGLTISIALTCYFFFIGVPRNWGVILYILIPTIILTLIYLLSKVFLGKSVSMTRRAKFLFAIWSVSLILFLGLFLLFKPNLEIEKISLTQAKGIIEESDKDNYFLIYSADSCIYCKDMKPVYKDSFFRFNKNENVFIVDLLSSSENENLLSELDVSQIPSLRKYSQGEETKRIDGVKTLREINQFIDNSD
ncbi:thioredoxin family protein [Amphibacillus cookii]|uniref:thioredoxin family protein n=1 Tax=Amphibacillus cookii TaxID=767787 RepID=UPI00195B276A|nr:thioredoxin family protein [Amphibacillus cookii]MBM7541874.1 thiol-disulfide isomerase/thioredoxin [Amphibacillus cookii]